MGQRHQYQRYNPAKVITEAVHENEPRLAVPSCHGMNR